MKVVSRIDLERERGGGGGGITKIVFETGALLGERDCSSSNRAFTVAVLKDWKDAFNIP